MFRHGAPIGVSSTWTGSARVGVTALRLVCAIALMWIGVGASGTSAADNYQSSIGLVRVGHWLELRGELADDGSFVAEQGELLPPQRENVLIGTIAVSEKSPRRFQLLGKTVIADARTRWRNLEPAAIAGSRVKVECSPVGNGEFLASAIATRGAGRDRLGGRVDELFELDGRPAARILGLVVRLPIAVEHDDPIEAIAARSSSAVAGVHGARDEDDQFGDGIALGATLRLSGQGELRGTSERQFDLDREEDLDRTLADVSARLRLDWASKGGRVAAAIEGRASYSHRYSDAGDRSVDSTALGETYLSILDPVGIGSALIFGRQDFDDEREWIFDQNLDGVRLIAGGRRVRFDLSATTTLSDGSLRDEAANNYLLVVSNSDRRRRLAAWALHRDFDLAVSESTTHVGVRATGKWLPSSDVWLDAAMLRGKRGATDLEGWGFDLGITTQPDWMGPFSFTVGYAYGSGGSITEEVDHTFRQTGFEDNNSKFDGVTSFRYYGELYDPELANLRVLTAGVGVRFARRSSLDLVGHTYQQATARRRLISVGIDRRADGKHTDIGREIDLILGSREVAWFDLEIVGAYFEPGEAFPADTPTAFLGKLQMRFRF